MKKIYKFLIITVLAFVTLTAKAQNDGISLTLLPNFSYNNFYNPGVPVTSNGYFGVGLSNINLSVYNSNIKYNNLYEFSDGMPVAFDANKFLNSLDENENFINTNFSLDIARFGFRIGKLFTSFDWRLRYNGEFCYSRDFLGFFINGNGNYLGHDNPADFSIGVDVNAFTEMALGLQYQINDKLTIGIRPKFLVGMANISVDDKDTKIYTDENTYSMTADVNINMKASTILKVDDIYRMSDYAQYFGEMDEFVFENVFDIKDNYGYGIDFGASYVFSKRLGVSAGVYDLGFIKWKHSKEKHIHKDNVVVNDAIIDDFEDLLNMELNFDELYSDLIGNIWDNDSLYDGEGYKTSLKTRIMLQGYYELCPLIRFSAVSQLYYINKQFRPTLTLAYSGSIWRFLNFTASYTLSKYSGNSVGAGVGINFGSLNLYAVTDNVMILSKVKASTMEMLTSYNAANVRFGIIFSFGNNKKK
ncbi:MAG: hypothetical protein IKU01_00980 [Bacteroidales bacterium]|nr:hypothetical protein [Bacteroidales bacterium]